MMKEQMRITLIMFNFKQPRKMDGSENFVE